MSVLPPETRARLAKIAGLLGSDQDGERAAAALAATNLLRQHGATWADAIDPAPVADQTQESALRWRDGLAGEALARQCLMWRSELTDWEIGFCRGLLNRRFVTPKQAAVLDGIGAKVRDRARAGGAR